MDTCPFSAMRGIRVPKRVQVIFVSFVFFCVCVHACLFFGWLVSFFVISFEPAQLPDLTHQTPTLALGLAKGRWENKASDERKSSTALF